MTDSGEELRYRGHCPRRYRLQLCPEKGRLSSSESTSMLPWFTIAPFGHCEKCVVIVAWSDPALVALLPC